MSTLPRINRITVDFDLLDLHQTLFKLIRAYIYARLKYGKDKVKVYVTSSRRGFRLYIEQEVDIFTNLIERALLDDDPYRIFFSLKRYGMSGDPETIDVEFYGKKNIKTGKQGFIEEINMEEILGKELIEKLEHTYGTKMFEDLLKEHFDKIVEKITKIVKPLEVCYISISEKYLQELIDEIINKAKFRVFKDIHKEGNVIIRIIASEELLKNLIEKFKDKIDKYMIVTEYSKH